LVTQQCQARVCYSSERLKSPTTQESGYYPDLLLINDWIRSKSTLGELANSSKGDLSSQLSTQRILPLILLFQEDCLYQVLDRLGNSISLRQCSFRGEGPSGELIVRDGPQLILRPTEFDIPASITIDNPNRLPILRTAQGRVGKLYRMRPAGYLEGPEFGAPDTSWAGSQLSTMNFLIQLAKESLGEDYFWTPVLPYRPK
jgi:hypothetical protein